VLAQTSDVVFVVRPDATIATCAGSENLGYSETEVRDQDWLGLVESRDGQTARASFERAVRGEPVQPIDLALSHADGTERFYEMVPARLPYAGDSQWTALFLRDIHRRKLLENSVVASEQRYRALIEQSPFGILIVDEELNLVTANQAYADQVGAPSLEALEGHNIMASPGVDESTVKQVGDRVRAGETISTSVSYTSLFGKQVDARVNIAPARDEKGDFVVAQMIFEDISESRRLEEQLRQSQKMEAVGRLAGGIAHDFNNNLTVILGLSEQLADSTLEKDERDSVGEIIDAAKRSAALTSQLLAFSRRHESERASVDLNRLVTQLEPMLHRALGAEIAFSVSVPAEPLVIEADRRLVEQVVVNLALNARDAMPNGGSLALRVYPQTDDIVRLEVKDDGEGMDEQTRIRAIEPFFTTKQEGSGTGLGLYTVYGIVNRFDGKLEIHSQPGQGTLVSIEFPREAASSPERDVSPEPKSTPSDQHGQEVVMVLEDQSSVRRLLCQVLERRGYTVIGAEDGGKAIELARLASRPIDLIVSDVRLPDQSGPETVAILRAEHPNLKVLYISGYNDLSRDAQGRLSDGFELITKPFSTRHLLSRVRELLDENESEPC